MENISENQFTNDMAAPPARPQFLKIICICSFVMSGLAILAYLFGTLLLGVSEETALKIFESMSASGNMQFSTDDPVEGIRALGMLCLIALGFNIVSLIGVIMMWNLNKIGFFVYVAGEFVVYFFGSDMNASTDDHKSYTGTIVMVVLDLAFVIMYFLNLKHMKKKETQIS